MSITSSIARKLRTVTAILTLGTVADGEYLRRSGTTVVGGPGGAAGIGGSTGATDNAILRADGAGGATLQSSGVTIDDTGHVVGILGTKAAPSYTFAGQTNDGIFSRFNHFLDLVINGIILLDVGTNAGIDYLQTTSAAVFGWTTSAPDVGSLDTAFARAAAGVVEVNNGTPGTLRDIKSRSVKIPGVAFASLPASPAQGDRATVTDSSTATYRATIAGGGANIVPAFFDGTNWIVS